VGKDLEMTPFFTRYFFTFIFSFVAIWCCDEDTVKHVVIIEHPEWSPTGNSIAILKDEFDVRSDGCDCGDQPLATPKPIVKKIYLADTNGIVFKQVTGDTMTIENHEWSPTGTRLAFTAYRGGLILGLIDSSHHVSILGTLKYALNGIQWSPDCSEILYSQLFGNSSQLIARQISGTNTRILFDDSTASITAFDWSKGNWIALAYYRQSVNYVATMNSDGSNLKILDTTGTNAVTQLTWSPDDSLIAYTHNVSSYANQQVFYFNFYTNEKFQRTNFPAEKSTISGLRFSPDGKYISVVNSRGLYVIERIGPSARQITTRFTQCSWSPDSRRVVYVVDNSLRFATIQ
jgi:Tol biopolymer transport system component